MREEYMVLGAGERRPLLKMSTMVAEVVNVQRFENLVCCKQVG